MNEQKKRSRWTREEIEDRILQYDRVDNLTYAEDSEEPVYQYPGKPELAYHRHAPFEIRVSDKDELLRAINKLSYRDRFILIAVIYCGGERGQEEILKQFSGWLAISPREMINEKNRALAKMEDLMNHVKIDRRGGTRKGAGRPKKSKRETGY